ncbi:23S rRNA (uracil(1939)-C(5))-methyltransferase RlmD [Candidatus Agathobaculum pullicola]|uniref:23S rRNA (uracil(1939)-C(5))-methyltransferase RlmD n=1 Tax=Candidatus Agathobaculum pullicola TaxID=2838426 RepID=UPI003F8E51BD
MELVKNKIYRCQIVDYTADGTGIGKIDGRAVFVPRTAVGDQCDVRIVKLTKNVAYARLEKLVVPSGARIRPICPVADKCGGCCYQHITYEEELRAKEKKVRDALTRIGGQDGAVLQGITGAPTTEHYRNKAQYPVGRDADGNIVTGFYRPRSHDIVPVERCLIQSETADHIAAVVRQWMQEFDVPPYDYAAKRGTIRHIYVRVGEKSGESQLTLIAATRKMPALDELVRRLREAEPSLTGVLLNHNQRGDNVILGDRTDVLWGEPMLEDRLCGHSFLLSPEAFYQVNHAQAERLYACAVEFAGLTGQETVIDLYCGAGTITLTLAEQAKQVIGVEIVPEAVENARQNAVRNAMDNVEFICADAGQAARQLAVRGVRPDVLVVDPPRKGLDEQTRDAILKMMPPRVVYVSCDPATLGRDVRELTGAGYRLVCAQAFDLFPRTGHVDTVCLLSKLKSTQHIEVEVKMDEMDLTDAEKKATYQEIKDYVLEYTGLKVSSLYIAQVKQKCGIIERENYNKPKSEDAKQPQCPAEKEKAIMEALKHFGMI